MSERRTAALLLTVAKGDLRAARSVVGRVLRKQLGVRRWGEAPYYVNYVSPAHYPGEDVTPHYVVDVTDEEMRELAKALDVAFDFEGWTGRPVDIYHD